MKGKVIFLAAAMGTLWSATAFGAQFPDVPTDHWAYNEVVKASEISFISGMDVNQWYFKSVETAAQHGALDGSAQNFRPNDNITREEMAVMLVKGLGYDNLVVSIKSSDVMMCVKAHELIAKKCPYPLHVGITESGTLLSGNIKSSVGLGIILYQGIGDTIRVSLTGDPLEEIKSAKLILKALGLRKGGIEVVSCPTCGRTKIDLIGLANKVETMVAEYPLDIKVAVMGCVVNGPGEAREADLGIAGGIGEGLLIKKGEIIRKVKEDELLDALRNELEHWGE